MLYSLTAASEIHRFLIPNRSDDPADGVVVMIKVAPSVAIRPAEESAGVGLAVIPTDYEFILAWLFGGGIPGSRMAVFAHVALGHSMSKRFEAISGRVLLNNQPEDS